ncbi:peptidase U32 family protein, partial [Candidatus Margulisiibacteriota bacterium]
MHKKLELLSPAGSLEKLETAIRFGADAVYVGAGPYSLRTGKTNFSISNLKQGLVFAHKNKAKVYLAMNIYAFDEDMKKMKDYLIKAIAAGIDAVIVSDPGVVKTTRDLSVPIHLSTQANTLNSEAVRFWQKNGVKRIILGREVSLKQARQIKKNNPKMEIELFIHGAMCMSYSGRCLLSKHMTGRSANRGECTHPCRWEYQLKETERPNEEFTIEEDQNGTYIMNSKDLCMIKYINKIKKTGIDSVKIEGRMKSPYYVALTTKIYREAIDSRKYNPNWQKELEKLSHRPYSTGFYLEEDDHENFRNGSNERNYTFIGTAVKHGQASNTIEINSRNYFAVGDKLDIIDPKAKEVKTV